jgi:hypothetical protein
MMVNPKALLSELELLGSLATVRWKDLNRGCLLGLYTGLICAAWAVPAPAMTAQPARGQIDKFALSAYCAEAQKEERPLADGQISYKRVAELASNRALIEHPNVYRDPNAWKTRIVEILDKYGDEPMPELCQEKPER